MSKFLISLFLIISSLIQSQQTFHKTTKLMGSRFDLTVVAENQLEADVFIEMAISEISRIEKLISSWDPNSQTSAINKNAGIQVDKELFDLIERALKISKLTDGAFDISYASMDKIWKFDGSMTEKPSEKAIKKSVENIGYKNIM